jgi:hypothetical protein
VPCVKSGPFDSMASNIDLVSMYSRNGANKIYTVSECKYENGTYFL